MFLPYVNKVSPTDYQKNARYPELMHRFPSHSTLNQYSLHSIGLSKYILCEKPGEEGIYVATESLSESINPKKMIYSANHAHRYFMCMIVPSKSLIALKSSDR